MPLDDSGAEEQEFPCLKIEACVLNKVDGAEVLEIVGSRRGGVAETKIRAVQVVLSRL